LAGTWACSNVPAASAPVAVTSAVPPAARMNSRRFRYTFLSVISELGISTGGLISIRSSLKE
jgi:hypothetical protein